MFLYITIYNILNSCLQIQYWEKRGIEEEDNKINDTK